MGSKVSNFFFRSSITWVASIQDLIIYLLVAGWTTPFSQQLPTQDCSDNDTLPQWCSVIQDINKNHALISNDGYIYIGIDASTTPYIFATEAGIVIGGIAGRDTIVSRSGNFILTHHLAPDFAPKGQFQSRSIINRPGYDTSGAISEQDFEATYTDTYITDFYDPVNRRRTTPLGIRILQGSYAWSYKYIEDILFMRLTVTNIGKSSLQDVFAAFESFAGATGFIETSSHPQLCYQTTQLFIAWGANLTGNPHDGEWVVTPFRLPDGTRVGASQRAITGLMFLDRTQWDQRISYNWTAGFGTYPNGLYIPQWRSHARDFGGGATNYPRTDGDQYFVLSNGEIDFDMASLATVQEWDPFWTAPSNEDRQLIDNLGSWGGSSFTLSKGPYQLEPGESFEVTMAIVGG